MAIRHLQIFSEVCLVKSITQAAERLNMSQPAVSTAIKELESYYGVHLFDRMNRRIYITPAGKKLLQHTHSILSQLTEVKESILDPGITGNLRIGSNIAFAVTYLPDILEDFNELYPTIPIYTRIQRPQELEDSMMHNELDFAIGDRLSNHGPFCYHLLHKEEVHLVCTRDLAAKYIPELPNHSENIIPITIHQLAQMPLLMRDVGSGSRDHMDILFRQANITPKIASESASMPALMKLCHKGFGVVPLPAAQAQDLRQGQNLMEFRLNDAPLYRNFYLIHHQSKYLTQGMLEFFHHLEKYFPILKESIPKKRRGSR